MYGAPTRPLHVLQDLLTHAGQTYEGGISGKPDAEAHGAYAFCALGCLAILDAPHRIIPRYASSHVPTIQRLPAYCYVLIQIVP